MRRFVNVLRFTLFPLVILLVFLLPVGVFAAEVVLYVVNRIVYRFSSTKIHNKFRLI